MARGSCGPDMPKRLVARDHRPRCNNLGLPDYVRSFDGHEDPERHVDRLIAGVGEDRARGVIGDLVLEHERLQDLRQATLSHVPADLSSPRVRRRNSRRHRNQMRCRAERERVATPNRSLPPTRSDGFVSTLFLYETVVLLLDLCDVDAWLWELHVKRLERIDHDLRNSKIAEPFMV